jgi:hypothetical protein
MQEGLAGLEAPHVFERHVEAALQRFLREPAPRAVFTRIAPRFMRRGSINLSVSGVRGRWSETISLIESNASNCVLLSDRDQ